ncbi:MAG TPA: hypothetical protein VM124_00310 [Candidatus Limnocylindrales bacterium]|nr:hypothetical protein [Candidatus Limnocylindrales bacterium]
MSDNDKTTGNLQKSEESTAAPEAPENPKQELKKAIQGSHQVLVSATTVFPFTLFPDTITVDRAKLTITHRSFFSVAEVMSIRIEDVLNVTANVGPLFGSIKITSRIFNIEKPYTVDHFWREDALKIKRITQGYIIALQKKIDCSVLSTSELSAMLDDLGKDDHDNV